MDFARDKQTNTVVDAEELWLLRPVDREGYMCHGCDSQVVPCSFEAHNALRPYFRIGNTPHQPSCNVSSLAELSSRGKAARLSDERGRFPASYPNRLDLSDEHESHPSEKDKLTPPRSMRPNENGSARRSTAQRPWTARTIRPICRQFTNFPNDRHIVLQVPGAWGTTYDQVFRRVKSNGIVERLGTHLFYAPLRWNRPAPGEHHLDVMLDAGERDQSGKLIRPCHALIQWKNWNEAKRELVVREISVARDEAKTAHRDGKKDKAWLFFIGRQDPTDHTRFHVEDHRLICCLVAEMAYPPYSL